MKIQQISCTQFAGIRNKSISLTDGLNVIYGKNESGKSTLVNLLSRTLFQNARIDGRKDKEFRELYFPGAKRGSSVAGDFADGSILFTSEKGVYTLSKEWGQDARCTLSTPEGVIRDPKKIEEALREVLLYGEGVYGELLFSSQRNADLSLAAMLDAARKTDAKQEIMEAVTIAFAESDGISVDSIEAAIQGKIEELAGKHWDVANGLPLRKAGAGRWTKELGKVLAAYYQWQDAKAVLEEIVRLEAAADQAAIEYSRQNDSAQAAESAYESFQRFAGRLQDQQDLKKAMARINDDLEKYREAVERWPRMIKGLAQSRALQQQRDNRMRLDMYETLKATAEEKQQLKAKLVDISCPEPTELQVVKTAQRNLTHWENQLCGMNVQAAIEMFGGQQIEMTSLRTGQKLDLAGCNGRITEAVRLEVPGVMTMELSPVDVDAKAIEGQIGEARAAISDILSKYQVSSVEELEALAGNVAEDKAKLALVEAKLIAALGETSFAELEQSVAMITAPVAEKDVIDREIYQLLGGKDLDKTIIATDARIEAYTSQYGSVEALQEQITEARCELAKMQDALAAGEEIPADFQEITNPEQYLAMLKQEVTTKRQRREEALTAKTAAGSKLEHYLETVTVAPAANLEKAERDFREQQALLDCWLHIAAVFADQKEVLTDNPMQDIAERFAHYLGVVSGGKVVSDFPEKDKLAMEIYSDNQVLDYGKLSEGTKETVSLAFRLAVLDHLFPEGGVIVFDDPFANMDADRTGAAWQLIRDAAQRHQVLFFTCREDYPEESAANLIQI